MQVALKIEQKLVPVKTEEQVFIDNFKFYDLQGAGYCNLSEFIKANEKIGIVLPKMSDFERVFNYYDTNNEGRVNYRTLGKQIFDNLKKKKSPSQGTSSIHTFDNLIHYILLSRGGNVGLLNFAKELKMIDFNGTGKMTGNDFIRLANEMKFDLTPNDYQVLFQTFELYSNGTFFYQELIKMLLNKFWSETRQQIADDLYNTILMKKQQVTINGFKEYIEYSGILNDQSELFDQFLQYINFFKTIAQHQFSSNLINKEYIVVLLKYFGYGIEEDQLIIDLFNKQRTGNVSSITDRLKNYQNNENYEIGRRNLRSSNLRNIINLRGRTNIRESPANREIKAPVQPERSVQNGKQTLREIYINILNNICEFNRITLFNFIKHFKYYDNDTSCVTKEDFLKVLKDYQIMLPQRSIDTIFFETGIDQKKTKINYVSFFNSLIKITLNDDRISSVNEVFDNIEKFARNIGLQEADINLLKRYYNPKLNFLNGEELANRNEFCEALDLFHYNYKGMRKDNVTRNEFTEFYYFISLLIPQDSDFMDLVHTEWKQCQSLPTNTGKNSTNFNYSIRFTHK